MPNQDTGGNNNTAPTDADAPTERCDDVHATTLNRFQLDQLAAIEHLQATDAVTSGAAIKAYLQPYFDEELPGARIYQNLDSLVDAGVLERTQHDGRTHEYTLTCAGQACLRDRIQWLADQAGLRVVDAAERLDTGGDADDDDGRPDGGAATIRSDGGWSLKAAREVLTPVHDDHEVAGVFSEKTIPVAEHDCLQVSVSTSDGPTIKFGCINCGHVSNAVTGFVQRGCADSTEENPLILTDGGRRTDSACENCGEQTAVAQLEPGDKINADPTHTTWSKPVVVVDATDTERWRVPFDEDWVFREFIIEVGCSNQYHAEIDADGDVRIYGEYDGCLKNLGKLTALEKVGEVSAEKKLRLSEPDDFGLTPLGERWSGGEA